MLSKKEIKDIQSLSLKKHRDETKLFIAEGPKIVSELAQLIPFQIQMIYGLEDWVKQCTGLIEPSKFTIISQTELERISGLKTPNNAVAVIKQFSSVEPVIFSFALYLDTIQDPGNFGTIIRTADWFGVQNIICSTGCADLYNSKVVQSTMASIARVDVYYDEEDKWLGKQSVPKYAATLNGRPVLQFEKTNHGILLVGNESKGLRKEVVEMATEKITIPRKGSAESLNAAVASGIILSHLLS